MTIQTDERTDEGAKTVGEFGGLIEMHLLADPGRHEHLLQFGNVRRGQRLAVAELGDCDVVLVLAQEMPGLPLEACEIHFADLR